MAEIAMLLAATLLPAGLYAGRFASRGSPRTPALRAVAFGLGVAVVVGAGVAPLAGRFWMHMIQHLLIGDLGPFLLVLGVDGRLLRPPLRALRALAHPLVALPLWTALLVAWHVTPLYDAALAHGWLHGLQHVSFLVGGTALWAALLEPVRGPSWFTTARKIPYVLVMWAISLGLSQVFLWSGHAYYAGYTLADQRAGGGVMLVEGSFVMVGVLAWLLLRIFRETEARQQLLDAA
jgi:putative membrane protein